jgi:hypothetical protein
MTLNTPQYTIRIRDTSLIPQGILSVWTAGDLVLRMNDVGNWSLTVKADDPLRQYFTRGNGIIVSRDRGDGSGAQTLLSGPIWVVDRLGTDNEFVLGGPTDDWWLKARNALPLGGRPYMAQTLLSSPSRYLRLGEASGTNAVDISANAQNGTYVNAPTLGVVGGVVGDPDTAITLASASSQRVTVPPAGLPTGNGAFSARIAFKFAANPAAISHIIGFGNSTATIHQDYQLYQNTNGSVTVDVVTTGAVTSAALTTGVWHLLHFTWDGTTLRLYVDGSSVGTPTTPGAQNVPSSGRACTIGSTVAAGSFLTGSVDEFATYNSTLSATQITADWVSFSATHAAYDTRTGTASTVIQAYVNANLVAATNIDRDLATLVLAADPVVGTSVTGNARWDNLLALCQQLASAGGDIGFKIIQTANGVLTFSCYQPNDQSANAKFSLELQNLFDYEYSLAGPIANSVDVLGGGTDAGRTAVRLVDSTSITNWGLVEGVRDARDTSDTPTMLQRGIADINAGSEITNLALTPRDTDTVLYGRDYNLGDIIAITVDGNLLVNKIRSVHILLDPQNGQEVITPGIGNPGAGEVAQWFDPAAIARQQAMARVNATLSKLSTAH